MDVSGVWPVWLPGPQPMASWITRKRAASTWAARLWAFSSEKMGRLWIRAGRLVLGQKVSDSEMLRILIRKWLANSVRREESIVFGLLWYVIMVKLRQKTKFQSLSWHFPVVSIWWQMRTVAKSAFRANASIWWLFQENNRNRSWAPEHIQYIDLRTYSIIETHFGCSKSLYQLAVLGGCFRWTFCSFKVRSEMGWVLGSGSMSRESAKGAVLQGCFEVTYLPFFSGKMRNMDVMWRPGILKTFDVRMDHWR